jgi:transposase
MRSATPVALSLMPGQAADITQAEPLLEQIEPDALIADKGYDSDALVENLEAREIAPVIPPKANRKHQRTTDFALYRERNLVERFLCTLKHFRAVAPRYALQQARQYVFGRSSTGLRAHVAQAR